MEVMEVMEVRPHPKSLSQTMEVVEVMEVPIEPKSLSQTMEVMEVMEVAAYGGFCAQIRLKKSSKGRLVELRSCSLWRIFWPT